MKNKKWKEMLDEAKRIFADKFSYTESQLVSYCRLVQTIFITTADIEDNSLLIGAIKREFANMPERDVQVLQMRKFDGCTLNEVGAAYKISGERVRQIEARAIKTLRKNQHAFTIDEQIKQLEAQIKYFKSLKRQVNTEGKPLEALNLKPRSFNALRRAGITTVEELINCSSEMLINVRNLGEESIKDIIQKVQLLVPGWSPLKKEVSLNNVKGNMPLEYLGLTPRTFNCLRRMKVYTVNDFMNIPEENLKLIRNLGEKSFQEILTKRKELTGNIVQ